MPAVAKADLSAAIDMADACALLLLLLLLLCIPPQLGPRCGGQSVAECMGPSGTSVHGRKGQQLAFLQVGPLCVHPASDHSQLWRGCEEHYGRYVLHHCRHLQHHLCPRSNTAGARSSALHSLSHQYFLGAVCDMCRVILGVLHFMWRGI